MLPPRRKLRPHRTGRCSPAQPTSPLKLSLHRRPSCSVFFPPEESTRNFNFFKCRHGQSIDLAVSTLLLTGYRPGKSFFESVPLLDEGSRRCPAQGSGGPSECPLHTQLTACHPMRAQQRWPLPASSWQKSGQPGLAAVPDARNAQRGKAAVARSQPTWSSVLQKTENRRGSFVNCTAAHVGKEAQAGLLGIPLWGRLRWALLHRPQRLLSYLQSGRTGLPPGSCCKD